MPVLPEAEVGTASEERVRATTARLTIENATLRSALHNRSGVVTLADRRTSLPAETSHEDP
ncbi:hypothetical protein GCM10018966_040540 [Streptomyces yanii]